MKIRHLSFSNINSLAGQFDIDLTHPSLADYGIFVISGPTGSGKTTILDAIAYAMYGKTPRQKDVTAGVNELMTREAAHCAASVIFERNGRLYRVSTEHRRKKSRQGTKAPQPFAQPERRFEVQLADGRFKELASKIKEVEQLVEQHSGLKYENFCRCMMLPQGDFARFLKAKDNERSDVLSTLTGTVIYQRIGEYVNEQLSELKKQLESFHLHEVKTEEELQQLRQQINDTQKVLDALNDQESRLKQCVEWKAQQARVRAELQSKQQLMQQHEQALRTFREGDSAKQLDLARRAARITSAEEALKRSTKLFQDTEHAIRDHQTRLQELTPAAEAAEQTLQQARQQREQRLPLIQQELQRIDEQLRPLEAELNLAKEQQSAASRHTEAAQQAVQQAEQEAARKLHDYSTKEAAVQQSQATLAKLQADAALPGAISGLQQACLNWEQTTRAAAASNTTLPETEQAERELAQLTQQRDTLLQQATQEQRHQRLVWLQELQKLLKSVADEERKHEQKEAALQQAQQFAAKLPSAEQAELQEEQTRQAYDRINRQASVEDKLEMLYQEFRDGKRDCCPCCGATSCSERPALPPSALAEAQAAHEQAKLQLDRLRRQHTLAQETLQKAQSELSASACYLEKRQAECQALLQELGPEPQLINAAQASHPTNLELLEDLLRTATRDLNYLKALTEDALRLQALLPVLRARDEFHALLRPFARELPLTAEDARRCMHHLQERAQAFTAAVQHHEQVERELPVARACLQAAEQTMREKTQLLTTCMQAQATAEQAVQELAGRICTDWGMENAQVRSQRLQNEQDALNRALQQATECYNQHNSDIQKLRGQLTQQQMQKEQALKLQNDDLAAFAAALQENSFTSSTDFEKAKGYIPQLATLQQLQQQLQEKLSRSQSAAKVLEEQYASICELQLTTQSDEELQAALVELQSKRETPEAIFKQLTADLDHDNRLRAENRHVDEQTEPLKRQQSRWQALYDVLGGTKDAFRKYAQGITLRILIQHANAQLQHLSERYMLTTSSDNPLELLIQDNYQDDKPRSCTNLSGGESFIVSLALALGLSDMAGDTRIESLFLDEGFGTLDPETLNSVLRCLEKLQTSGRMIGIITHVAKIQDSIPAGIKLLPTDRPGISTICKHPAVTIGALATQRRRRQNT